MGDASEWYGDMMAEEVDRRLTRRRCHHTRTSKPEQWCTRWKGHVESHSYTPIPLRPRKDAEMAMPALACRFCRHRIFDHNPRQGCPYCTCVAHPGEGSPKFDAELSITTIRADETVGSYRLRKDPDMPRSQAAINREIELAQQRLDLLVEEREARASLPDEPEVGAVITFKVQLDPCGIVYSYAAHHFAETPKGWTITGEKTGRYSWDDLLNLMARDVGVKAGAVPVSFHEWTAGRTVVAKSRRN